MGKSTKVPKGPKAQASKDVSSLIFTKVRLEVPFTIYNWYLPLGGFNAYWGIKVKRKHIVCLVQDKNKDYILDKFT